MKEQNGSAKAVTARRLVREFSRRGITVGSAESCTGGLIAKLITDVPGSSAVLAGAFVTYTNEIKIGVLGVDANVIARDTEVSASCAAEMASCARKRLGTTLAVSATGFAGPGGGTDDDPVGTVYLGVASPNGVTVERFCAPAGATRRQVRTAAAVRALDLLWNAVCSTEV
ncbi:MAG: CinA family protein [Clostridia bacterium]|nr:CinA family protein [Clostridia bacterium]